MSAKAVRWVPLDRDRCTVYEINKSMFMFMFYDIPGLADMYRSVICIGRDFNEVSFGSFMPFEVWVTDDCHVEMVSNHHVDERG